MQISPSLRKSKTFLVFFMGLSLQACSTVYKQTGLEGLGRSEVATIEMESCAGDCPVLQEVDGAWRGIGSFKEYEIKPGMRNIKFIYVNGGLSGSRGLILEFEAKKGAVYGVRANADHSLKKWHPEIIDNSTKKVVSKLVGTGFHY